MLAATAGEFAAQNKRDASHTKHKKSKPFQRAAANRYNVAQQTKKISGDGSAGGGHTKSATGLEKRAAQRRSEAAFDRQAKQSMSDAAIRRARHTGDYHRRGELDRLMSGEFGYFEKDAVIWVDEEDQVPFMEELMANFVDGNRGGGRSSEGGHPGHPPPHHPHPHGRFGEDPPGRMDSKRGGMGHHGGPRFTGGEQHPGPRHHGQQRQGPRPSMFSVLVDWVMGDSSSSDSNDEESSSSSSSSDSSSDDWGVLVTVDGPSFGGDPVPEPLLFETLLLEKAIAREPMMMGERDSGFFHGPSHPHGPPPPPHGYGPLPGAPLERGLDGGRDHIRSRNRLPEDLENRGRAWLEDSLDGEDIGPVEGILAFFFFIGTCTLLLLPFFLLGRALRKLVRAGAGGAGGGSGDAPDGYQALPDDTTAAVAAGRRGDDDDNVVVTGTPVNPPPSIHL